MIKIYYEAIDNSKMKLNNIYKESIFLVILSIFIMGNYDYFFKFFTQNSDLTNTYKDTGYYIFFLIITAFVIFKTLSRKELNENFFSGSNLFLFIALSGLFSYFLTFNKFYTFRINFLIIIFINLIFFFITKFIYKNIDKKIIFLSNLSIIFSIYVFHPFSNFWENQVNYFPPALNGLYGNLKNDFIGNITDPYPFFNYLIKFIWSFFDINTIFILNIIAIALFTWSVNVFTIYLFKDSTSTLLFYFFPLIFSKYLVNLYQFIPGINRFSLDQIQRLFTYGIGTNRSFSEVFEPTAFDILFLPILVLVIKGEVGKSLILSALIMQFHFSLLVPVGFIIFWILFIKKLPFNKLKIPFIILISSFLLMVFFSETRLSSDESTSELADNIMTNRIISVHRLVSPTLTFGIYNGDTPAIELHKEKIGNFSDYISFFNDETHGAGKSVSVEIDRIVFYLLAILLISNKAIKYFYYYSLSVSVLSMIYIVLIPESFISSLIRDIVPWRITSYLSIISTVILIGKIFEFIFRYSLVGKLTLLSLMILIPLQFLISEVNLRNTSFNNYQSEYHQLPKLSQNLVPFQDSKFLIPPDQIYFSLHNEGIAASPTRYHPYKKSEIVNWFNSLEKIIMAYQGNNCEDLIILGNELEVDIVYIPKSGSYSNPYLLSCEYNNSLNFEEYNLIVLNN